MWHSKSKLETIIWTLLVTKIEFPFKNKLDYQIKPLKPVLFYITLVVSCTLYFDALVIELFKICLVMGQNSEEGTLLKVAFNVSRVTWGVSLKRFSVYMG